MEKGKIIITVITIALIIASGSFYAYSQKKPSQYGYEVTKKITASSGTTTATGVISVATGTISMPNQSETLAYINLWNGDVKREQKGDSKIVTKNMPFSEGDSLTTGNDASAEIIFADNSVIRMNADSRLSFMKLAPDELEVRLDEGDIWARVLKPFSDTSFFTISTSDVSAGVQGTSVRMRKTLSGTTSVAVIDSYSDNKDKEWVILRYNNPKRKVWSEQRLKAENQFTYSNSGHTTNTESMSGKIALKDTFIRENTKRDLLYIEKLTKNKKNNANFMKKLMGEMREGMPKREEVPVFFDEPMIQKIVLTSTGMFSNIPETSSGWSIDSIVMPASESFMVQIRKDMSIIDNRQEIRKMKRSLDNIDAPEEYKKKTKKLIQEKETTIMTTLKEINEDIKKLEVSIPVPPKVDTIEELVTPLPLPEPIKKILPPVIKKEPISPTPAMIPIVTPEKEPIDPTVLSASLDIDKDGIQNEKDNCPLIPNPGQRDTNWNGKWDLCDKTISSEAVIQ